MESAIGVHTLEQPYATQELVVFGGLFTEANPVDLPPGASPLSVNTDYLIGSVGIRPGLQSIFAYPGIFIEKVAGFAQSVSDGANEAAWSTPANATLNTPGQYASVALNFAGSGGSVPGFDKAVSAANGGSVTTFSVGPAVPALGGEWGLFVITNGNNASLPGFTLIDPNASPHIWGSLAGSSLTAAGTFNLATSWAATLALFYTTNGLAPTIQNTNNQAVSYIFTVTPRTINSTWANPNTAGNAIIVAVQYLGDTGGTTSITDDQGDVFTPVATSSGSPGRKVEIWVSQGIKGGTNQVHVTNTLGFASSGIINFMEFSPLGAPAQSGTLSQELQGLNFGFSIPSTQQVTGFEIEASGHQTDATATSGLVASVPGSSSPAIFAQLPSVDGTIAFGTPMQNWGITSLSNVTVNNPNFTVQVRAQAPSGIQTTFDIYALKVKVFLSPNPAPSFNYLKTFAETSGDVLNLFLGSDGVMYQETLNSAPGSLTGVYAAIQPNSFAQSCTQSDREFIGISNLKNGTDIPYTYDGNVFNRLSQVGPGASPACTSSSVSQTIVNITQPSPQSDVEAPGHLSGLLWSAGPGNTQAGNVVTVYYSRTAALPSADANLQPGVHVQLAGLGGTNSIPQLANGVYVVTSVGRGIPPGAQFERWYFTIQQTTTLFNNQANHQEGNGPLGTYQVTTATMTTTAQVPNLQVGNQFQLTGTGGAPTAGYDGTWTVLTTPNASQLQITSTALTSNTATYSFTLVSGTNPVVGQFVTVTGTLNGNGIFNITNVAITATSPGSFSVQLFGNNVNSAAENGSGVIAGTIFTFDPAVIVGTKSGGSIVTTGIIGTGSRQCCYSFLTTSGYITQPSPITTFTIPPGASTIVVSGLLTGPSNVVARIIHFTAANGSNFYNIPQPVTVISNGASVINSSTWVLDNSSTSATLSFSDGVLLTGIQIDAQGNNLFETAELGSCLGFIPYAQRIFAIGEQDKVTNLLNWSFDGGILGGSGASATYPAGWTVDSTNGGGNSVISSPIFGFAYSIKNSTGSTQSIYGMITQPAFQDEFKVPIIQASTLYSVRVTAALPTGASTGQLVVDLFSASLGAVQGTFTVQFSQLASSMNIFSGTLLTNVLAPVPNDLTLRLYATNILNGVQVTIDRVEVFPTLEPTLSTIVTGSYLDNFEAFDQVTGVISGSVQNQQPIRSAFVLFDVLYLVKTKSFVAIRAVDGLEPVNWGIPRVVSNSVGTPSIYGVTSGIDTPNSGEEWAIIAGEAGAYIFNGGEPIKLSEEIQSLWNQINWTYGHTIWVQNDIVNRRILFGVPLKTPNTWLPTGIIPDNSNPTTPNVVLDLSYKQLPSASHLANAPGVRPTYRGDLISSDYTRKWSVWTMSVPAAAFILRQDTTSQLLLGNSSNNGKIYQLVPGRLDDDGVAIDEKYFTYAFLSTEQEGAKQVGPGRKDYKLMLALLSGVGDVAITAYPNTLTTAYPTPLLPNITLPIASDGDVEIPINVTANRCFFGFESSAVGAGFSIARLSVALTPDPWSPVRGIN